MGTPAPSWRPGMSGRGRGVSRDLGSVCACSRVGESNQASKRRRNKGCSSLPFKGALQTPIAQLFTFQVLCASRRLLLKTPTPPGLTVRKFVIPQGGREQSRQLRPPALGLPLPAVLDASWGCGEAATALPGIMSDVVHGLRCVPRVRTLRS